jgi:hypothetical protein
MAISPETEAIIDRLKAEGQLTRNSGANSIRSVKIQLNRFEDVFNTISANIAEQTNILRKSMSIQEEAIEARRREEDIDELRPEPPTTDTTEPDTTSSSEKEKGKGLFDLLMGGGVLGLMKNIFIGGAGLFVAYNFAKGIIDQKTGGGFSRFEESMINTFREVDWTALGNSFIEFATKVPEAVTAISNFLTDPLSLILAGAGLTAAGIMSGFAGGALARGVTRGIIEGVLGTGGGQDGPRRGPRGGLINLRNVARAGALGILVGGLEYFSEDVKNWLKNQGMPEDWANETVDSAITIGTFTSMGMMFGPKGALVGAAIGTAYVLGRKIYEWFEGRRAAAALAAQERLDAINVITGEGLGDATGAANTVVSGVTTTTDEARSLLAEQMNERVAEIFERVRQGMELTPEEIETLREAFNAADVEIASQRLMNIQTELMNAINTGLDGLGTTEGDLGFSRAVTMLENLKRLSEMDPDNISLSTLYNQSLSSLTGRAGLGGLGDFSVGSEDVEALTPIQREALERLRGLEYLQDTMPERPESIPLSSSEVIDLISQAGASGTTPSIVIGRLGGDTFQTVNSTRAGDMNIADTKVFNGNQGGTMSPLSLQA